MSGKPKYFPLNSTVVQGDDEVYTFRFADKLTGAPIDISTWTFDLYIKSSLSLSDVDAEVHIEQVDMAVGDYQSPGANDELTFTVPATVTALLTPGTYNQDLRVQRSITQTIGRGQFILEDQ